MKLLKLSSALLAMVLVFTFSTPLFADTAAQKIEKRSNAAVAKFIKEFKGAEQFINNASGYLVFPKITKAGLMVGGSYGEGVLRVNGQTQHYYSVTSASLGFQWGAQQHAMIIAFLSETSLKNFIASNGWEAGVDGTITIADWGKSKDLSSISYEKPIVAFIFGEKGLMGGISLEGNKFQRIVP
ncbi:YSC84-related protein [Sulfurovum sp.]|jgi:lipid-binding SYLF domain-containing protein|uniref:lipid-binding SYLF domain-containing protein n=1 Tax=Sulfurovum sp. TaxID=1969726 RepID=UPI002A368784|nr:YSC84-related protein [Sulfurovum sp.]MDY0403547.1 YSC84-related protein [Sulfurovum sp.]